MGICHGRIPRTETRAAQTELNPFIEFSNRDLINARYQNYRPISVHSRNNISKQRLDNVQLKNSIINDWKHPNRFDFNFSKIDNQQLDNCGQVMSEQLKQKHEINKNTGDSTPTPSGVWPINGSGDCNFINLKKKKNISQSRGQLNRELDKSNLNINTNYSDEEDVVTQRNTLFNEIDNGYDSKFQSQLPISINSEFKNNKKLQNRKFSMQRNCKLKEISRSKSTRKLSNQKIKLGNNNSNNYHSLVDDKALNNAAGISQKYHSSSLLEQDCYPIQYTFYVDDNDICTKPFYDRRMVAIAKTCRCRIYFHAKADESEKPLYYKGKPVRPVTITSPDMACLKRCLGSIDSQFPYFNCKAFLSLSS